MTVETLEPLPCGTACVIMSGGRVLGTFRSVGQALAHTVAEVPPGAAIVDASGLVRATFVRGSWVLR